MGFTGLKFGMGGGEFWCAGEYGVERERRTIVVGGVAGRSFLGFGSFD
jgi:hypothetical protein